MKLHIISNLVASFLVLVLGTSQAVVGDEAMSNIAVADADIVLSTSKAAVTSEAAPTGFSTQPLTQIASSDVKKSAGVSLTPYAASTANLLTTIASSTEVPLDFGVPPQSELTSAPQQSAPPAAVTTASALSAGKLTTAASLFATKNSPGAIAVGAAEGNFTLTGKTTSLYWGHTDPGNHVTNKGFCSWNRAANLTVAEADRLCLRALQRQAAATERKLKAVGLDPIHAEAVVNGADLWNQSNSAGPDFAVNYKKALDQELTGNEALVGARVEAFRNSRLQLQASGLFGICAREPYYRNRLVAYMPNSESWRWECIALDQKRRVEVVGKALKQNLRGSDFKDGTRFQSWEDRENFIPSPPQLLTSVALNFDPDVVQSPTVPVLKMRKQNTTVARGEEGQWEIIQKDSPSTNSSPAPQSVTGKATQLDVDNWTPNLKKTAKAGDKIVGYAVTSPYGMRIHPITGLWHFHGGVDLDTPMNTNLYAISEPGTKTTLKCWTDVKGGGLVATMISPSFPSLKFDALHLNWCRAETNGPTIGVAAGEIVARTGSTGRSTGPHLHFQARDLNTGKRISPPKGFISWLLTGREPKTSWASRRSAPIRN